MAGDSELLYQKVVSMLNDRMERIEKTQERMAEAIERQASTVEKVAVLLAKHEEHSNAIGRAFDEIESVREEMFEKDRDKETRLRDVEVELPTLKLTRGWVISFTLGGTGLLCLAVAGLVLTR